MNTHAFVTPGFRYALLVMLALFCCNDEEAPPAPEVIAINPASALPNTLVSIAGKFFSPVFSENKVTFNGKEALVVASTATQLNVMVPAGAASGPVTVVVRGRAASNQPLFTVETLPSVITRITPTYGSYKTAVTIIGENFHPEATNNVVTFNGVLAEVQSATTTSLTVRVPARAGTGAVVVNGTSAPADFKYVPDVIVGGYERQKDAKIQGIYWSNGKPTLLADLAKYAVIYDVKAEGDDIYAVGFQYNGTTSVAKYWKNGVEVTLGDGKNYAQLDAIAIAGSDVYVAGYEQNPSKSMIARYWKNGVSVPITDGSQPAYCFGIAVSGTDVHTVGQLHLPNGTSVPMYWKNTTAFPLASGTAYASANDIAISGNDVHIAGYQVTAPNPSVAMYWKNGTPIPLTDGKRSATSFDIEVVGNDVFIAGYEANGAYKAVAKYWKNGVPVILSDGATVSSAVSIKVLGDDVYVSGYETNSAGINVVKYWKNGVKTSVSDGSYEAHPLGMDIR